VKEKGADSEGVRAVTRALAILKAFSVDDAELSATELLGRLDLSKPTLYRLIYTLIENGFLVADGDPQRFRLGPEIARMVHVWTSTLDLPRLLAPAMRDLWQDTGETISVFVQNGEQRTSIAELPSMQPLSFKRGIGYSERIVLGASGRAILAHVDTPPQVLARYLREAGLDPAKYQKDLERVHRDGYAVSRSELLPGAVSVAAPFFIGPGKVGGCIAVFGPEARMSPARVKEIGSRLVTKTREVSATFGVFDVAANRERSRLEPITP
jgi:IclR family acetate operon transcriptional repressor